MNLLANTPAPLSGPNLEHARFNMVEQQIRTWEVLDPTVLDLLLHVHREDFVPPGHRALAFADMEIPIGHDAVMLSPKLEARMLQEVAVQPGDAILEVGTGTGHMTALLASLGRHVYSVDIVPEFTRGAGATLKAAGITNVTLETGDAARSWDKHGPYDIIVLTGSEPVLSDAFAAALKPGGRLIAVVGEAPVMQTRLITCVHAGAYNSVTLFETCIPSLKNAPQPQRFIF